MPFSDPALWMLVRDWPLPFRDEWDDGASPGRRCWRFEDNLAKAGDWTEVSAERITGAYRRFLYLKALTGETLTPSECIDKAWHLHLGLAQDYAALEAAVGRAIPHRRGLSRKERAEAYDRGLRLWRQEFDRDPDPDLWPAPLPAWREKLGMGLIWTGTFGFFTVLASIALAGGTAGAGYFEYGAAAMGLILGGGVMLHQSSPESRANCG